MILKQGYFIFVLNISSNFSGTFDDIVDHIIHWKFDQIQVSNCTPKKTHKQLMEPYNPLWQCNVF